jgi:YtkA-like protein
VIFFWLHERRLGLQHEPLPLAPARAVNWRPVAAALVAIAIGVMAILYVQHRTPSSAGSDGSAGQVVQRVSGGSLDIALLSPTGTLHQGRNIFTIEFRSSDGRLVDAGVVRASANMAMPGMVVSSGLQVQRTATTGVYQASAEFGMAGAWHMAIEWDGPAGKGSVSFEGAVQ